MATLSCVQAVQNSFKTVWRLATKVLLVRPRRGRHLCTQLSQLHAFFLRLENESTEAFSVCSKELQFCSLYSVHLQLYNVIIQYTSYGPTNTILFSFFLETSCLILGLPGIRSRRRSGNLLLYSVQYLLLLYKRNRQCCIRLWGSKQNETFANSVRPKRKQVEFKKNFTCRRYSCSFQTVPLKIRFIQSTDPQITPPHLSTLS